MTRKSKIKSTLDTLFSGGRTTPDEAKPTPEKKVSPPEKKPAEKTSKTAPAERKAADIKKEEIQISENKGGQGSPVIEAQSTPTQGGTEKMTEAESKAVELKSGVPTDAKVEDSIEKVERIAAEIDKAHSLEADDDEHLVIFTLGSELYGLSIHSVESIIKIQAITEVPRTAEFILGVTNLRGTVIPVLDLRKRFNLDVIENSANTRIIIVNAEGAKVGVVVDEVTEVLKVAQKAIQPPPPMSTTIESAFINGIAKINDRLVILLDLEKVLASSARQHNRK